MASSSKAAPPTGEGSDNKKPVSSTALVIKAPKELSILPSGPLDLKPIELGIVTMKPTQQEINNNRQYQWVSAVATSQEMRLQKFGQLRKNPGYDLHDGFIEDNPETMREGTPMMRTGNEHQGKVVTYVRQGSTVDMFTVSDPETLERYDLHVNDAMPMPLEDASQGEYAVIVGIEEDSMNNYLNGRLVVVGMKKKGSETERWVQIVDPNADEDIPPLQIKLETKYLVSVPRDKVRTPWEVRFRMRAERAALRDKSSSEPGNEETEKLLKASLGLRDEGMTDTDPEDNSDGELPDEKGYQGPQDEYDSDDDDYDYGREEDLWEGAIIEVQDINLGVHKHEDGKKKTKKEKREMGAIVDASGEGKMFALLIEQRGGLGVEVKMVKPKHEEHILIEDEKIQAIPPRKLLDYFTCNICNEPGRDHELVLCEGPACMHAEHVGCGNLACVPKDEWRCRECTDNLTVWEKGMYVMVSGKSKEHKNDPPNPEKDGLRLARIVSTLGVDKMREVKVEVLQQNTDTIALGASQQELVQTFEEVQVYRTVAPEMLVYMDKPSDEDAHGKTGYCIGWLPAPTSQWLVDIDGWTCLGKPDQVFPVLAPGMIVTTKKDETTLYRLDKWDEHSRVWVCKNEKTKEEKLFKARDVRVELATGMAATDKTNGALVSLKFFDPVKKVWHCKPLSKRDFGGNLALLAEAPAEEDNDFTRDASQLTALHHKGDWVKTLFEEEHKGKIFELRDWNFHTAMWILKDTNKKKKFEPMISADCTGIVRTEKGAKEERKPKKNNMFVTDNIKRVEKKGMDHFCCVFVVGRKDVTGPLRLTQEEAEQDFQKVKGIMMTQGQDEAVDWISDQKEAVKEEDKAKKSGNARGRPKKDGAPKYEGPFELDELRKLSVKELKERCTFFKIPDSKQTGLDKSEFAKIIYDALQEYLARQGKGDPRKRLRGEFDDGDRAAKVQRRVEELKKRAPPKAEVLSMEERRARQKKQEAEAAAAMAAKQRAAPKMSIGNFFKKK